MPLREREETLHGKFAGRVGGNDLTSAVPCSCAGLRAPNQMGRMGWPSRPGSPRPPETFVASGTSGPHLTQQCNSGPCFEMETAFRKPVIRSGKSASTLGSTIIMYGARFAA